MFVVRDKNNMENEINIKVPEGKKAVQNVDKNGNIVIKFEDVDTSRSKSWDEFCKNNSIKKSECYISHYGSIIKYYNVNGCSNRDINEDKHLLETKEDAEGLLALIQLIRLHNEWVGDWNPDWGWEASEKKYFIGPQGYKTVAIDACWCYSRLLVFPTKEMAEEFLNCFRDLIETAIKFI